MAKGREMSGWQPPEYDPRQQPPAAPPQWQQGTGPAQSRDPWQASAQPAQPRFQPAPQQYAAPPPQPPAQPRYAPPSPQPPRSRRGLVGLGCGGLGALVILIAILAGSHSAPNTPAAQQAAPSQSATQAAAPAAPQTVTYVVTGSAAQVTYGPAGSDTSGTVPMSVTKPLGSPLYYAVTAQLQGSGTVSCKIEVDGTPVSASTATGGYNIAQCEISQDPLTGQWQDTNG